MDFIYGIAFVGGVAYVITQSVPHYNTRLNRAQKKYDFNGPNYDSPYEREAGHDNNSWWSTWLVTDEWTARSKDIGNFNLWDNPRGRRLNNNAYRAKNTTDFDL